MRFRPAASRGGFIGLVALAAIVLVELAAIALIVRGPIGPRSAILGLLALVLVPVIGRLGLWVLGYYRMAYEVSRDGLVVQWGFLRQVIPIQEISRIASGRELVGGLVGIRWPGYMVGQSRVRARDDRIVEALVYATTPVEGHLVIFTSSGVAYVISPADRTAFIEEFKVRRRLGPVQRLTQETVQPWFLKRAIWADRPLLRAVVIAVLLNAILFAATAWRYPELPAELPLQYRFDPEAARSVAGALRPRSAIWMMPRVGLAALGLNVVLAWVIHPRARHAAALLVVGVVVLQIIIGIVLIRVM
jgi:hypothetical protein